MQKKSGFTLIELIIVIAILCILGGIVAPKLFRAMNSAKEQQCRNNLKQLQTAAIHYALEHGRVMPHSAGMEYWGSGISNGKNGWIAWIPEDRAHPTSWFGDFGTTSQEPQFSDDTGLGEPALWAVRNGSLWDYVRNEKCYFCPVTAAKWRRDFLFLDDDVRETPVNRTYAMNAYFGGPFCRRAWATDDIEITQIGVAARTKTDTGNPMGWIRSDKNADSFQHLPQPSRLLLFSEAIPSTKGDLYDRRGASQGKSMELSICPNDGSISVKAIADVNCEKQTFRWGERDTVTMAFPKSGQKTDLICGLHEPLIRYEPMSSADEPCYFGSALAVFVDGHIEKVFPVYESSDGVASKASNSAWFLCHGLRPAEKYPGRD